MATFKEWKREIIKHKYLVALSIIFFVIALMLNDAAGDYVAVAGKTVASDLILDHLPVVNLSFFFIYGYLAVILLLIFYPLFFKVRKFPLVISQFSLLVLLRSFFITLTHLATPTDAIILHLPRLFNVFAFHNDLFFSGHTALPFLGFLLFRKEKLGIFFLIMTFVLASTVLFMHVHYSIDVFAAFFITYGSFKIGNWLFKRMRE